MSPKSKYSVVDKAMEFGRKFEKAVHIEPAHGPFTGTFAETKAEKDLRISQAVVDKAQAALHDADPHNASDIKIKRKKMEDAEKHHHKVWIAHDKEVKATEAKQAKKKAGKE